MTVSNKIMERIMRQDSNLSPYDGFRIGGIGKILNQIGLNQRRHHIIYKVSSSEFAIPMELTGNVMEMQLIPKEEILEELSKLREEVAVTMKWIHIGTIEQPVIGRYEGMLEIVGHEILVVSIAGREHGSSGICTTKPRVFPKEAMETLSMVAGRDFSQKILILSKGNNFIQTFAKYVQDNNRNLLIFTTNCGSEIQGLIDRDSFYKESEEEIKTLKEALQEIKPLDISEESKLSLENVKRLIQRNFSENPLTWWDRNKIEATLKVKEECKYEYVRYSPIQMNMDDKKDRQMIIKEHINLGLIEPGVSAYSSPGFLVRNYGEMKRGKPRSVINYQGINKILEFDGYYIPSREHLIDCIKGAKVFSKFDCKSDFYQIKMENESKKFTAFPTPQKKYI
ncbi:UNVERIFIED_CONTAM: Enzymatic polyprotein [Sesamum radiatum]|uniref:Enzymatic polyprotein n=1 Tax=Sesamum radiatum TaxID=300843 RepID=A0AAW2Q0Z7_SESRA